MIRPQASTSLATGRHELKWLILGAACTLLPIPATAGCGYTGFCGTIAFLGQTADRTKAVFLSQTVQAGSYVVQPTEGLTTNIDAWTTSGPTSRISVSDRASTWGGTHILYSMDGGQAFVDSATQNPGGRVFPNGYRSPDSIPVATISYVTVSALPGKTEITVTPSQAPTVVYPSEQIVEIQEIKPDPPQLTLPQPIQVLVPPQSFTPVRIQAEPGVILSERQPVRPPMAVPNPQQVTLLANPPKVLVAPPLTVSHTPPADIARPPAHPQMLHISPEPSIPLIEKQLNPPALARPSAQQTTLLANPVPTMQPALQGIVSGPETVQPSTSNLGENTLALGNTAQLPSGQGPNPGNTGENPSRITGPVLSPCIGSPENRACTDSKYSSPSYATWFDTRSQSISDRRSNLNQHSRHQIMTLGLEKLEQNRIAYGLALGLENEKGTLLSQFVHFETKHYSLNPYLSYRLTPTWTAVSGLTYKNEKTAVQVLDLKGEYTADHYSALLGAIGHFNWGSQWITPSFFYSRNQVKTKEGTIKGVVSGQAVDVITQAEKENSQVISGMFEWGTLIPHSSSGMRLTFQTKLATHYQLTPSVQKPWSSDIQVGLRALLDKATSVELEFGKLAIGQNGLNINQLRAALVYGF